jgi:hypothetical protein
MSGQMGNNTRPPPTFLTELDDTELPTSSSLSLIPRAKKALTEKLVFWHRSLIHTRHDGNLLSLSQRSA